jgi:glycosyltransferase involved in cell wall biosynthesis
MSETPLVSIIIPCYKQASYLPEAIESALAQTYPAVEVIVVDDGSPDDTSAVAGRYGERVTCIRRPNGGLSAARNTGIERARGTYLKFLDADDHLHPEQVAHQVEALAGRTDRLAMTGVRLYRDGVPEQFEDHTPEANDLVAFLIGEDDAWIPPIGYLVPAHLARAVGGFDPSFRVLEDWDFFIRVGLVAPELVSDRRIGAFYRLRVGSMSTARRAMQATRARLLVRTHDALRDRGRPDWFGLPLLRAEQDIYQRLVLLGGEEELTAQLLPRIKELQGRVGFGGYGWRFRLLTLLVGYAAAERLRARVVKLLKVRPPESLDTGAWREQG